MKDKPVNLPASVLAKLRNVARAKNTNYQLILRRYAIERLLYRLSISPQSDQFVLKGAMLFTAWLEDPFRPTQDLDLLGHGDPATSSIETTFRTICETAVDDDGLVFDTGSLRVEPIREEQRYGGVRVKTTAFLGKTRIPVQVDIGFGDAITPAVEEMEFPPLLASEGPRLKAYPKETVIAEKLQAIVELGRANSRMKDFYDLLALSRLFDFDGQTLNSAVCATFERRQTAIPKTTPEGLDKDFAEDPEKQRQWVAFVRREPLFIAAPDLSGTISEIASFALPVIKAAASGAEFRLSWLDGGPWRP